MINSKINLSKNKKDFFQKLDDIIVSKSKSYCCLVNPNVLVNCYKDKNYFNIVKSASFNVCDAISVELINNITKKRKIKSYPGPDLFRKISKNHEIKQFFIGGESTEMMRSLIKNIDNCNLKDHHFYCPPFLSANDFDYLEISKKINALNPHVIWVGLVAPKQEIFMSKLLPKINKGLLIGVGAAFSFYSAYKNNKRAPNLFRKLKIEWLYRLLKEPKKILPRLLNNVIYLPRILIKEL